MSVSGADDIDRALEKLSGLDMKQAVADAIQLVRSAAVNNCSVNTGELRQSIFADVEGNSEKAEGICWTNKAYAPYVNLVPVRKARLIMQVYLRTLHQCIHSLHGGSMRARLTGP